MSQSENDQTVQGTEKYRDDDEANESKYEAENGLERFRVTVCNTLFFFKKKKQRNSRAVTDTDEDTVRILITDDPQANVGRQLEPWSSMALTSFLWVEPRAL